jgi:hypothetical protein
MGKIKLRGRVENAYPEPQEDMVERIDIDPRQSNLTPSQLLELSETIPWMSTERRLGAQVSDEVVRDFYERSLFLRHSQSFHVSGVTFLHNGSGGIV